MRIEHLHCHRVPEKTRDKGERQHERKRKRHRPVKNNHRHDINVRIEHPIERRDEDLDKLGDENERNENEEENHGGENDEFRRTRNAAKGEAGLSNDEGMTKHE